MSACDAEVFAPFFAESTYDVTPHLGSMASSTDEVRPTPDALPAPHAEERPSPSTLRTATSDADASRKRKLESLSKELAPKSRKLDDAPAALDCVNPANPLQRVVSLADVCESIFASHQLQLSRRTGVLAALCAGSGAVSLGAGINGDVWRVEINGRQFAL